MLGRVCPDRPPPLRPFGKGFHWLTSGWSWGGERQRGVVVPLRSHRGIPQRPPVSAKGRVGRRDHSVCAAATRRGAAARTPDQRPPVLNPETQSLSLVPSLTSVQNRPPPPPPAGAAGAACLCRRLHAVRPNTKGLGKDKT